MECNVVRDLMPLYVDGCCSEESRRIVEAHMESCASCKLLMEEMKTPAPIAMTTEAPHKMSRLNDWRASLMQSVLLFLSFAAITVGVALEARTPVGSTNGFWAVNLVVPATGWMLSLANWYFIRLYPSRKRFSNCCALAFLGITICAFSWAALHYERGFFTLAKGMGLALTAVFCALAKLLSDRYARMLGKE